MDISVIIASRNRSAWLPTCLTHLEQQTFPAARFEVIVADAGSHDGTASVVERFASGSPVRIRSVCLGRPEYGAAMNLAIASAEGRILLFLADDELASPRLVQHHAEAQERHGERGCLMGAIHVHPQVPAGSLTRLSIEAPAALHDGGETPLFLDWQASNISLPRRLLDGLGVFTERPEFGAVEHQELAWRLQRGGVECLRAEDTRSYVWQPVHFEAERARYYNLGYGLYHLFRLTHSRSILQRHRLRRTRLELVLARFLTPRYVRACRRQETENTLFVASLYRRILSHDRTCGFQDALGGHPRRPPVSPEYTAAPAALPVQAR